MKIAENHNLGGTMAGIVHILEQKIKARKIRLAFNSLFFTADKEINFDNEDFVNDLELWIRDEFSTEGVSEHAIMECLQSIKKLKYIKSVIAEGNLTQCKLLLYRNLFDRLHMARIKDFLECKSVQTSLWPVDYPKRRRRRRRNRKKV